MSELLKLAKDQKFKPNAVQSIAVTFAFLLFGGGVACGSSINEQNPIQTPESIPTPSGLVPQNCDPFTIPDWTAHGAIVYACPNRSEEPERRLNVIIKREENEAQTKVTIHSSRFVKGNEAWPGEVKISEIQTAKPHRSTGTIIFQNPVNIGCNIIVTETGDNQPPTVAQACPQ